MSIAQAKAKLQDAAWPLSFFALHGGQIQELPFLIAKSQALCVLVVIRKDSRTSTAIDELL